MHKRNKTMIIHNFTIYLQTIYNYYDHNNGNLPLEEIMKKQKKERKVQRCTKNWCSSSHRNTTRS